MIVFVIGGHGSGKTTAVRSVMQGLVPISVSGRKYPIGYESDKLFVVGHYEIKNGGADTVRPLSLLQKTIDKHAKAGRKVVVDGIGQAGIDKYMVPLMRKHGGLVLYIETDVKDCERGIKDRGHKLSRDGVRRGWTRAANMAKRMEEQGIKVTRCTRANVSRKLKESLR